MGEAGVGLTITSVAGYSLGDMTRPPRSAGHAARSKLVGPGGYENGLSAEQAARALWSWFDADRFDGLAAALPPALPAITLATNRHGLGR